MTIFMQGTVLLTAPPSAKDAKFLDHMAYCCKQWALDGRPQSNGWMK